MNLQQQSARLRPFVPVPFGRYTLLTPLAVGGMGEIFLARLEGAKGFEKLCVIKKILPSLAQDGEFVERFVNEAKILVKLSHGSIAQVLDVGLFEGDPYIALEFVDGKDLRRIAARAHDRSLPLPLTFVLYVMTRVLDALAYAHRKRGDDDRELGLIHRDVSPQNILVSYEGEVKVIDFGLAKSSLSSARTNPSMILGKFLYMSPEQARHQKVDRRSDLYSAGLCLYELVCGKNPFDDVPPHELMARVANPVIPPLHTIDPLCPPAVQEVVAKALQLEPAKRFQTAEEFRGKLTAALLEIDPGAGPESVSRYMRETFAADHQQERRLLASLKTAVRPDDGAPPVKRAEHETAVFAVRDLAPSAEAERALSLAPPPPPDHASQPDERIQGVPLSFVPTPRSAAETVEMPIFEAVTAPGVDVTEHLRRATLPKPSEQVEERDELDHAPTIPPDALMFDAHGDTQPRVVLGEPETAQSPIPEDTQPRVIVVHDLQDVHAGAEHTPRAVPPFTVEEQLQLQAEMVTAPGKRPRRSFARRLLRWTFAVSFGVGLAVVLIWVWERYGEVPVQPPVVEDPRLAIAPPAPPPIAMAAIAPVVEDAGAVEVAITADDAGPPALAAAVEDAGTLVAEADPLLAPLSPEPAKAVAPKKVERARAVVKASTELKQARAEWAEVLKQFRLAKRRLSCEADVLRMICFRANELTDVMSELQDDPAEIAQARKRIRSLRTELRGVPR